MQNAKKAWRALFRHFNKNHGRGNRGYRKGEMMAIKLNMNNAITHHDTIELNSSPFVTLALVRSLVHHGGVRQQDIVLCEPSRAITDSIYNKVHREFPRVRIIDNIGGQGRKNAHNNVSQDKRNGKPQYKTFVDWIAHKDMGQKALLYLIDGTYGSRDVNGAPNPKWMKSNQKERKYTKIDLKYKKL